MKPRIYLAAALGLATLAWLAPMASASAAQAGQPSFSQVLQEVKIHAQQADYDAEVLDSYARSELSWESHSVRLREIRMHVNDLFHDYSRLQSMSDNATPQQRQIINRLEPVLRKMANSLIKTIQTLNENQKQVNMPWFRDRIHSDYLNINQAYEELCKCAGVHA